MNTIKNYYINFTKLRHQFKDVQNRIQVSKYNRSFEFVFVKL